MVLLFSYTNLRQDQAPSNLRAIQLTNSRLNGVVIAPLWRRVCAWILDAMLVIGLQVAMFLAFVIAFGLIDWLNTGEFRSTYSGEELGLPAILGWLWLFLPYLAYHTLLLRYWNGHTPGKNFMNVIVLSKSGERPSLVQAFIRTLLLPLSTLSVFMGYLFFMRSRRNTSFHDWIAKTVVVQEEVEHQLIRRTIPPRPVPAHH